MPRILISASFPEAELIRQTPHASGRWEDFEFIFAPTEEPVDAWVVNDDLCQPMTQLCPSSNTLLLTYEPASIRRYRSRFTSQFGQVWTAQTEIKHRRVTYCNEAQRWYYALHGGQTHGKPLDYSELSSLACPSKPKLLSVVCSSKAVTADHQKRLEFVRYLQSQLGDAIDVFGRGIHTVSDKSDAIWPYKYHIVLENDHSQFYMSEKICDAYLGWSYPLYFGGPEAYHRFPEGSFTAIDIYQPEQALSIIRSCIAAHLFEDSLANIEQARNAVLNQNNLFSMLAHYWRANLTTQAPQLTNLIPKSHRVGLVARQLGRSLRTSRQAA